MNIDPEKFEPQGLPTKEQVRTVWDAHPKPSARKVADLLVNRGYSIGWRTIARWKAHEWREEVPNSVPLAEKGKARGVKKALKAELAKVPTEAVKEADGMAAGGGIVEAVTGGKLTVDDYKRIADRIAELAKLSVEDRLKLQEATRVTMNIILMEEVTRRGHVVALIPKDTGSFMADANDSAGSVVPSATPIQTVVDLNDARNGDDAKVIEGKVNQPSPLALKIRQLREAHA